MNVNQTCQTNNIQLVLDLLDLLDLNEDILGGIPGIPTSPK